MKRIERAGDRVRIEMIRCGYTRDTLSEKTGISEQVIRGILANRASVSTRNVCALAAAFGYSAGEFIDLLTKNG